MFTICSRLSSDFPGGFSRKVGISEDEAAPASKLFDVERLGAGRLALRIERDFFDARLGLAQQILAAAFERLAALVDGDRFLERHLALFEPLDDRFQFLDRALERQLCNIAVGFLRHSRLSDSASDCSPDCAMRNPGFFFPDFAALNPGYIYPCISVVTWAATELPSARRS